MTETHAGRRSELRQDEFATPVRRNRLVLRCAIVVATIVGIWTALHGAGSLNGAAVVALLHRLGWTGSIGYVLYSLSTFCPMGFSWALVSGRHWRQWPAFTWARMLREAASDLLPFSQLGGMVVAANSLTKRGVSPAAVYAGMTADLTTEMISQGLFTVLGLVLFTSAFDGITDPVSRLAVAAGFVSMLLIAVAAWTSPYWLASVAPKILKFLAPGSLPFFQELSVRLRAMHARPARIAGSTMLNFGAWTMSAAGAWIVLQLMGTDLSLSRVLALEALIFALRSVAFMVPGGIGIQEAGYVLFAPTFGLTMEATMALAFAKRSKDVAIGLPTLIVWQLGEARTLTRIIGRMQTRPSTTHVSR